MTEEKPSFRILLAEDNAVNQVLAVRLLEKRRYSVEVASNGQAAVEAFEKDNFHLVLMDLQMRGMDGFEATAIVQQKRPPVSTCRDGRICFQTDPEHGLVCSDGASASQQTRRQSLVVLW